MSHLLFHDGQFYRDDKVLVGANSRALRYGDGLFETMKVNREKVQLGEWHMERLFQGLRLLHFDLPHYFTPQYLLEKMVQLAHRNGHGRLARVRLMVFRGNGGLYDPENHYPHHVIQTWTLPDANHEWNENGLVVGVHEQARKAIDVLANCKTNNYLTYVLGALEAKKQKWNDALVLNTNGHICDATIANVFLVKGDRLLTPALGEGPVAGVTRRYLIEALASKGIKVEETSVSRELLVEADEVFLTNTSYGMRWVQRIGDKTYTAARSRELYREIIAPLFGP